MYSYMRTETELWTVGHYDPEGKWIPESDHGSSEEAADRVVLLNGGTPPNRAAATTGDVGDRLAEILAGIDPADALKVLDGLVAVVRERAEHIGAESARGA
ncbi:hypothetical protein [Nocardia nova]